MILKLLKKTCMIVKIIKLFFFEFKLFLNNKKNLLKKKFRI